MRKRTPLEVQNDVGHVFAHAGNAGELVQHVVDLHAGDGTRPASDDSSTRRKRVAQRQAKTTLQRFCDDRGGALCICALL